MYNNNNDLLNKNKLNHTLNTIAFNTTSISIDQNIFLS